MPSLAVVADFLAFGPSRIVTVAPLIFLPLVDETVPVRDAVVHVALGAVGDRGEEWPPPHPASASAHAAIAVAQIMDRERVSRCIKSPLWKIAGPDCIEQMSWRSTLGYCDRAEAASAGERRGSVYEAAVTALRFVRGFVGRSCRSVVSEGCGK